MRRNRRESIRPDGPPRLRLVCLILFLVSVALPRIAAADDPWLGMGLGDALARLRESGLKLVYSSPPVSAELVVLVEPLASEPREILEELLAPHGLSVTDGPAGALLVVRAATAETGVVRGRVVGATGKGPRAARVVADPGGGDARSGRDGRFELRLPPGLYTLTISAPGFVTRRIEGVEVAAHRDTDLEASLPLLEIVHESIRVTSAQGTAGDRPVDQVGLQRESLAAAPSLVDDPHQDVERLPGVAGADTRAALNVRGGRGDEVLILFDGLEIHDPYHARDLGGGLFSVFDATLVEEINYYGGAFPSQYGNRTSAVMEMTSTAAAERAEGSLTVSRGLFRASGRGPIGDGGNWLISGRVGDPELILGSWVAENVYSPTYYDLLTKASRAVGSRTTLSAHLLLTRDDDDGALQPSPEVGGVNSEYENLFAWLTADTAWNSRLLSRTLLAWGNSQTDRAAGDASFGVLHDRREYTFVELKQDWTAVASPRHNLRWGFGVRRQDADYDYRIQGDGTVRLAEVSGTEYSLYVSETMRVAPTLLLEFGLRHDDETYSGLSGSVTSPRFNLAWSPGQRTTLRAGWGRYHQYQRAYELQIEDGVDTFEPVETSEHRQIVVEHRFAEVLRARVSIYEKSQHGVRSWFENLFDPFAIAPELREDRIRVRSDRALSRGVELALQGRTRFGLDWSASYVASSAEDEVDGRFEPRAWDQRNAVDVGLIYRWRARWEIGATFSWHSGWPTTAVDAEVGSDPGGAPIVVPVVGPRNGERYPAYGRVDLRAARKLRFTRHGLDLFVNVANLTGRKNVCCTEDFDFSLEPDGSARVTPQLREGLDRTISFGMTWNF